MSSPIYQNENNEIERLVELVDLVQKGEQIVEQDDIDFIRNTLMMEVEEFERLYSNGD